MAKFKLLRFRRLGIRGFLGITKIKRSLLSASGIRSIYAPFRKYTNLRRRVGRGLGREKFLPQQLLSRGALPQFFAATIGNSFFGETRQASLYRKTISKLNTANKLSALAGPFQPIFQRRSFTLKTLLPKLGAKLSRAAGRAGTSLARSGAKIGPPPLVQPPGFQSPALRSALRKFGRQVGKAGDALRKYLAAQNKQTPGSSPKSPRTPRGPRGSGLIKSGSKTTGKKRGRPASPSTKIPKPKLSKQERVLRQLEGRKRNGSIKNIYYPRKPPARRPTRRKIP